MSERRRLERLEKSVEKIRISVQKLLKQYSKQRQHQSRRGRHSPPPPDVSSKRKGSHRSYACNTGVCNKASDQKGRGDGERKKFHVHKDFSKVVGEEPRVWSQTQQSFMTVDSHDDDILTSIAELMQNVEDQDDLQVTESKACVVLVETKEKDLQNYHPKATEKRSQILDMNHFSKSQKHEDNMQQDFSTDEMQKMDNMELPNIILFGNGSLQSWQQQTCKSFSGHQYSSSFIPSEGDKSLCYQLPTNLWPSVTIVAYIFLSRIYNHGIKSLWNEFVKTKHRWRRRRKMRDSIIEPNLEDRDSIIEPNLEDKVYFKRGGML